MVIYLHCFDNNWNLHFWRSNYFVRRLCLTLLRFYPVMFQNQICKTSPAISQRPIFWPSLSTSLPTCWLILYICTFIGLYNKPSQKTPYIFTWAFEKSLYCIFSRIYYFGRDFTGAYSRLMRKWSLLGIKTICWYAIISVFGKSHFTVGNVLPPFHWFESTILKKSSKSKPKFCMVHGLSAPPKGKIGWNLQQTESILSWKV